MLSIFVIVLTSGMKNKFRFMNRMMVSMWVKDLYLSYFILKIPFILIQQKCLCYQLNTECRHTEMMNTQALTSQSSRWESETIKYIHKYGNYNR